MTTVAWLLRVEFGALVVLFAVLLGRQTVQRCGGWRELPWRSAEGVVLLAVTLVVAGRYGLRLAGSGGVDGLPGIGPGWLESFGAGCAIYLGAKAVRAMRDEAHEENPR